MDSRNIATRRRQERREALNEYLSNRGKLDYVFDNIEKMENEGADLTPQALQALKAANEQRIRLLNKYIPDLKAVDVTTNGNELTVIINGKDAEV